MGVEGDYIQIAMHCFLTHARIKADVRLIGISHMIGHCMCIEATNLRESHMIGNCMCIECMSLKWANGRSVATSRPRICVRVARQE